MAAASPLEADATVEEIQQELARRHLIDFTQYTLPSYKAGPFHHALAERLDQFLADCVAGREPRLLVFAPIRHGKSELVSRRFPAWALGKYPELQFIGASYGATLAQRMNRDVQRIIEGQRYTELFPDVLLPPRNGGAAAKGRLRNSDEFELLDYKGTYRGAGIGGGINGMGADVFVIDDPVKDARDANSKTIREAAWEWYTAVASLRLDPGAGMLITMTRWNVDDLAGRLIAEMNAGNGEKFEIVSFPAIAIEDEAFRKKGEALDPVRWPLRVLERKMAASGSYVAAALFQQNPVVKGGAVFEGDWWQFYSVVPKLRYMAIYADTASKTLERHDYSVFQTWGLGHDGRIYLLDQIRGKWKAPELRRRAIAFWVKWSQPRKDSVRCRSLNIEDKSSGTGLIQDLRVAELNGKRIAIPVKGIPRHLDKAIRADDGAPQIEAGNVVLPESAPWLSDYLMEFEAFTKEGSHAHDDQIDPTLDAINDMLGGAGNLYLGAV